MLQTLHNLPREARDTLFLLAVVAWVVMPLTPQLPIWCIAAAACVLLWRGWLAVRNQPLPSRWWLTGLLLLCLAATFNTHRTLLGRDAGVTTIVVLLALKTLEMRSQRDAFVLFFLGFFALLSNFFYSQGLLVALAMLLGLMGLLTALVNSHMPVGRPPLWQAARTAGWMALLGAPIMVVLFVLFPRVAPLWGVPSDAMAGRSGLSARMEVGAMASLALNESVAMRIRFDGPPPTLDQMYFRGPVLSSFDGREWGPLKSQFTRSRQLDAELEVKGAPFTYQITMEVTNRPWLLLLDAASTKPQLPNMDATMGADLQWQADRPISDLMRFTASSHTQFRHGPRRAVVGLQDFVALPTQFNPRTLELARSLQSDPRYAGKGTAVMIGAVMELLRTGGYTYTLEPGTFGIHSADEFWFDKKVGFCEHIASGFVVLMRGMGIPARIVTGYQGGQLNSMDGFWTVRQSDAHAWAEVWTAEQGWLRVDPTSAVAPARTGTLTRLAAPLGPIAQALQAVSPNFSVNLKAMWEAANNRWNQWVLNYTQSRQFELLRNLGFSSPSWEDLGLLMAMVLVGLSLAAAVWTLWDKHQKDPWLRLLTDVTQRLQKAGFDIPHNATPRQLAALLQTQARDGNDAVQWLLRLEASRYANAPSAQQVSTLRREWRQLAASPTPK